MNGVSSKGETPKMAAMSDEELLAVIIERCGEIAVVQPVDTASRLLNIRGENMPAAILLRPGSTDEVAFVVRLARSAGKMLIAVGGATGLVDGLRPVSGDEWYLSLERMRQIERIDQISRIAVVEAGVVLQTLQDAAAERGAQFAVDLGARGSATIGGLISTNAGGERVLRYGMMREQVLGLEVVLSDGTVLDLMAEVLKNNTGYDLKQLFIGAEGTLGIVTRAVLKLRPAFAAHDCALLALSLDQLPLALNRLEKQLAGTLSACEVMWPEFLALMTTGPDATHRLPLAAQADVYLLVEGQSNDADIDHQRFMRVLETMMEDEIVVDAAVAQSEADRRAFWAIRNDIGCLVRRMSPLVAFDVSVPVVEMASYVEELRGRLSESWCTVDLAVFGHVADNNLHVVVSVGPDTEAQAKAISEVVYRGVVARRGSISAEHGIGLEKRTALAKHAPAPVTALMQEFKKLLDPDAIFNPGKVV